MLQVTPGGAIKEKDFFLVYELLITRESSFWFDESTKCRDLVYNTNAGNPLGVIFLPRNIPHQCIYRKRYRLQVTHGGSLLLVYALLQHEIMEIDKELTSNT